MDLAIELVRDAVGRALSVGDGEGRLRDAFSAAHARCAALEEERRVAFEAELRRRGEDCLGAALVAGRSVAARHGRPVESFVHFAVLGRDAAPAAVVEALVDLVAQRLPPRPHVTTVVADVVGPPR